MAKDQIILDLLKQRDGVETRIELINGKTIFIWNITWGYDIGDIYAHITSNISPSIEGTSIDLFYTNEIVKIVDREDIELFPNIKQ